MTISHEVSSEILAALLNAKDRSPRELEELKETLIKVHSTLQEIDERERKRQSAPLNRKAASSSSS